MFRVIIVILIIAGLGGYWFWTTTPQYSVLQIRDSIRHHDLVTFEKYVDMDSIASQMVDDMLTRPVRKALGENFLSEVLGFGLTMFVKPELVDNMKQKITNYVEGTTDDADQAAADSSVRQSASRALKSIPARLGFTDHIFKGIAYVRSEDKLCFVGLNLHNAKYNADLVLELKLRGMGGYFRLAALSNLQDFMSKVSDLQSQHPEGASLHLPFHKSRLSIAQLKR